MKVATQEIENSQVVLDIEVEDERMAKAVDQAYRRIVNRINVPGFRKGKAPRALVERMVGREALVEDAVEHLVPLVVEAAVKEQDLKMVARPRLEVVSTEPLQVKATVPVQPKVELGEYHTLKIELEAPAVDEAQIQAVLDRLREQHGTWEPVERPVAVGDRVAIDLRGEVDGRSIMNSEDAEYVVDPEGPEPAPGFAHQLVGMEADDERSFVLTLPEEYRDRELASKPASFTVTLHGVKERRLPDLDDDFASTVDGEYENVEQLRDAVRSDLSERDERRRHEVHEEEVIRSVVDQAKVEIPPQLIEEEAQRILDQLAANLERQGITVDQYIRFTGKSEADFRAELLGQGERSVRSGQVLQAVARAEGLDVTDDELRAEVAVAAADAAEAARLERTILGQPEARERVASALRQRKARRYLMETVGGIVPEAASPSDMDSEPGAAPEPEPAVTAGAPGVNIS